MKRLHSPAIAPSNGGSRASSAGTRWRWCVQANKTTNVGGHISTFASAATLYEVGFNHFFHGRTEHHNGDIIYFQGHASPGMYARAFVEGRLSDEQLQNFRQELQPGGGLSSYPHPWLMPNFWQFPTVSMGLGPIMSIYQARYNYYLHDRGLGRHRRRPRLGVPRRRRDRRTGNARRHFAGRPRETRQSHLGHQLQPATARRPGPRQRQDHPGTGRHLPRGRLERHQGHLGQRLGPHAESGQDRSTGPAHGWKSWTASIRITSSKAGPISASSSSTLPN